MKLILVALGLLGLALVACSGSEDVASPSPLPSPSIAASTPAGELLTVTFQGSDGPKDLVVELADSPDERYTGLRNRESMDENRGMLFAWPGESNSAFGMPDTYIPLTIAFIDGDGTILHLEDMEPLTTDPHRSPQPYRYAVEANQGWYARNGIEVGDTAEIPGSASAEAR